MNKRTSVFFIFLVLILFVSAGVYVFFENRAMRNNDINNSTIQNNNNLKITNEVLVKDKFPISVGDKLGNMIVTSVEPFSSVASSFDPATGTSVPIKINLSQDNVRLKLTGPITIPGMYQFLKNEAGFAGYCMSDFDEESLAKLPSSPFLSKESFFCFRNEDVAKTKLGEHRTAQKVTVKIDNFELNRYPSEVVDRADLVDIVFKAH